MRLTDIEKQVLSVVELQANLSVSEIQKKTGLRSHVIQYALQKLKIQSVWRKIAFINMRLLGYDDYVLYFSMASLDKQKQTKLLQTLIDSPLVTWIGEMGGEYQYGIALYSKNLSEFVSFLDGLSKEFQTIFLHKSFIMHVSFTRFNRKYLFPGTETYSFSSETTSTISKIDEIDERILQMLTKKGDYSQRDIAQELHIPTSTVTRRIRRLEKEKIIGGYTYAINSSNLGVQMFELLIYGKGISSDFRQRLFLYAKNHPQVIHFLECVGEWDFQLAVEVEKSIDMTIIMQEMYERFPLDIQQIKVIPVFRFLKYIFFRPSVVPKK